MMKKKFYLLAAILLMNVFQSCQDEVEEGYSVNPVKKESVEGLNLRALFSEHHVISVSEASETALKATEMFADESTRANDIIPRTIESIGVYGRRNTPLRTANASEDTLYYVFNFEDNRGFAIVAADDRIPTQILAYVDKGSLENDVDNPGLRYTLDLMQHYVESSIDHFENKKDSFLAVAEKNSFVVDAKTAETRTIYTGTAYSILSEMTVGPLISVTWGQKYPYNMYVPKSCDYETCYRGKDPVGCVATATAQLMSYWKYPSSLNSYAMDWTKMCSTKVPTNSSKTNLARLMREIGARIGMNYGCDGSGAKTTVAYDFLKTIGYKKFFMKDFDMEFAIGALQLDMPLLVRGYRGRSIDQLGDLYYYGGHCWIVDGYKRIELEEVNYRVDTSTGSVQCTTSEFFEFYFHNNWGWEGEGNGYFASGCFNLNDAFSYDNGENKSTGNYRYKNEMFCVYR